MKALAGLLSFISLALSALFFSRVSSPRGVILAMPQLLVNALSPGIALLGAVGALLGALARAPLAVLTGAIAAASAVRYVLRVTAPHDSFASAFGPGWEALIPPERSTGFLRRRWSWRLAEAPEPRQARDVVFATVPESGRPLLCDLWQPPEGVAPSGLAFIYCHGSGWHFLDKDVGTRSLFRHLAAQGHVIVDVAYRLCPESDWRGMLDDVRRAVAWMKANGSRYGVDPERVVVAGGSAGGHLALLAAYTARCPDLVPSDLRGSDLSVRGVVSWYGPTDMRLYDEHAGTLFSSIVRDGAETLAERFTAKAQRLAGFELSPPAHWERGRSVEENMMRALFGGTPAELPDLYRVASPITYVGPGCPPTLLLQGKRDPIVPAAGARELARRLRAGGVPVVHVEYPQTDHAFDLILPRISPPAQAALYETERFLALLAATFPDKESFSPGSLASPAAGAARGRYAPGASSPRPQPGAPPSAAPGQAHPAASR